MPITLLGTKVEVPPGENIPAIPDNIVTATVDGDNITLYVDGVEL